MRSTALSLLTVAIASHLAQGQEALGQVSQTELRAYTEYASRRGEVTLPRPQIDWDRDPIIYFFESTIPRHAADPAIDPLGIPLNAQFTVTAIRTYRNTAEQKRFWGPVLDRVEREIASMLSVIGSGELKDQRLREELERAEMRIARIYQEQLDRLAKEHGKQGAGKLPRMEYHVVDLFTDPGGGVIEYMPAGRWSLYLFMTQQRNRRDFPRPNWTTIRQTEGVQLGGKNWFRIRWPDGREHKELVQITDDQRITFTPAGRRGR
jgi:hypothetical protein